MKYKILHQILRITLNNRGNRFNRDSPFERSGDIFGNAEEYGVVRNKSFMDGSYLECG